MKETNHGCCERCYCGGKIHPPSMKGSTSHSPYWASCCTHRACLCHQPKETNHSCCQKCRGQCVQGAWGTENCDCHLDSWSAVEEEEFDEKFFLNGVPEYVGAVSLRDIKSFFRTHFHAQRLADLEWMEKQIKLQWAEDDVPRLHNFILSLLRARKEEIEKEV